MNNLTIETEDSFASLLDLAANNDVEGFKRSIEQNPSCVDEVGLWYSRRKGSSKQMANEIRTPLMVAATYGSIDVMKLILSLFDYDINRPCGLDKSTVLHCAASGGAVNAVDVVKLLLAAGADPNSVDDNGHRPVDVIVVRPKLVHVKNSLEELLQTDDTIVGCNLRLTTAPSNTYSPPLSALPEDGSPTQGFQLKSKLIDVPVSSVSEKKEYPVDPSLLDIQNSIYSTDEFRMYSFKVHLCSRAYSHDWTECPFVHPGENARRRDPRKYHYSCFSCPDFRKGSCQRGDMCDYAHGVFECWLHPAQYRTRLCKDGTSCSRRVCFFAHTVEELRPLCVSTGSGVPSPRSSMSSAIDFTAAMSLLHGVMSPPPFTPPMSPSANGMLHSSVTWPQPNVPALHLPGSNLHSSRLRSSLNARDIPVDDFNLLPDYDVQQQQLHNELSYLSPQHMNSNSMNCSGQIKNLIPSNLDDLFSAESSSPQFSESALSSAIFSPTHKSAVYNQFQQQQSLLSPVNTNFSSKNLEHALSQTPFGVQMPGRMSPRNMEPISPISSRISMLAQREKQQQFRSLSFRELSSNSSAAAGSPVDSWSKWGSSNGSLDWAAGADELGKLRRSSSFKIRNYGYKPDLGTTVSSVAAAGSSGDGSNMRTRIDPVDHGVLGALLEQMQHDYFVAQQNEK